MPEKGHTLSDKKAIQNVRIACATLIVTIIIGFFAIKDSILKQSPSQENKVVQSDKVAIATPEPTPSSAPQENKTAQSGNDSTAKPEPPAPNSAPTKTETPVRNSASVSSPPPTVQSHMSPKPLPSTNPEPPRYQLTLESMIGIWSGFYSGKDGETYEYQLELHQKNDSQDGYSLEGTSITAQKDKPTNRAVMKVQGKLSDSTFHFYELGREIESTLCAKAGALELTSPRYLSGRWYGSETDLNCGRGKLNMTKQ